MYESARERTLGYTTRPTLETDTMTISTNETDRHLNYLCRQTHYAMKSPAAGTSLTKTA